MTTDVPMEDNSPPGSPCSRESSPRGGTANSLRHERAAMVAQEESLRRQEQLVAEQLQRLERHLAEASRSAAELRAEDQNLHRRQMAELSAAQAGLEAKRQRLERLQAENRA